MAKEVKEVINYHELSEEELSRISEEDHHEDVVQYDIQQNALALVMIGSLALISGVLFLILSFRRVMNRMQGLDVLSLQFFVCLACFGLGAVLLSIGLTRFFKAHAKRKQLREEITEVSLARKEVMSK